MSEEFEVEYYVARLRAEREAAATATCDVARAAHRELASRYAGILAARGHPGALLDSPEHERPPQ